MFESNETQLQNGKSKSSYTRNKIIMWLIFLVFKIGVDYFLFSEFGDNDTENYARFPTIREKIPVTSTEVSNSMTNTNITLPQSPSILSRPSTSKTVEEKSFYYKKQPQPVSEKYKSSSHRPSTFTPKNCKKQSPEKYSNSSHRPSASKYNSNQTQRSITPDNINSADPKTLQLLWKAGSGNSDKHFKRSQIYSP